MVVDTPGAVTCALCGRPKSEASRNTPGLAMVRWRVRCCWNSLLGGAAWGLSRDGRPFLLIDSAWRQSDSAQAFLSTTQHLTSRRRSAKIQADTTQLTQVCECELVPATRTGNPDQKLTGLLRKPWRSVSLVYPHVRILFPLVLLEVVAKRKNWRPKPTTSPCVSH